jgi:prepilin peptidase CpaA
MLSFAYAGLVLLFPVAMAFAAASDLITMTISNRLTLMLLAVFAIAAPMSGLPAATLGLHLAIAVTVLVVTFALFTFGWIGGGDAKLAAVIALWMGPGQTLPFLIYTALLGGLLTFGFLAFRKLPLPAFIASQDWIQRLHSPANGVPYGIALAAGALLVFPQSEWFAALAAF